MGAGDAKRLQRGVIRQRRKPVCPGGLGWERQTDDQQ